MGMEGFKRPEKTPTSVPSIRQAEEVQPLAISPDKTIKQKGMEKGEQRLAAIKARLSAATEKARGKASKGEAFILGSPEMIGETTKVIREKFSNTITVSKSKLGNAYEAGKQKTESGFRRVAEKARLLGLKITAPVADKFLRMWNAPKVRKAERNAETAENYARQAEERIQKAKSGIEAHKAQIALLEEEIVDATEGYQAAGESKYEYLLQANGIKTKISRAREELNKAQTTA